MADKLLKTNGGDDGARTRDLRRDRTDVSPSSALYVFVFLILMGSSKLLFLGCYSSCYSSFSFGIR